MKRLAIVAVLITAVAAADRSAVAGVPEPEPPSPGWEYLYDGGALPFVWGAAAVALIAHFAITPPKTPRLFSNEPGGKPFNGDTVPFYAVVGYAGAGAIGVALVPSGARMYHLKGYAEASLTTVALTELAKETIGRHRPHYSDPNDPEQRRSFWSGHASTTFATSTYLGLYLHGHLFNHWRAPGQSLAWWELVPDAALAAGSVWVGWTRLHDNQHNPSDVITGAAVGTACSVAFYAWQEHLYRGAKRELERGHQLALMPMFGGRGLGLSGSF